MAVRDRRELLSEAGALLYGDQWQRALARGLGPLHPDGERESIDDRSVRRWVSGERPIPAWVFPALREIAQARAGQMRVLIGLLDCA